MMPKYPDIHVELTGHDGGVYGPLARCLDAMTRAGISSLERDRFTTEATGGDYDDLLRVSMEWLAAVE
jgi:hypothetical protein